MANPLRAQIGNTYDRSTGTWLPGKQDVGDSTQQVRDENGVLQTAPGGFDPGRYYFDPSSYANTPWAQIPVQNNPYYAGYDPSSGQQVGDYLQAMYGGSGNANAGADLAAFMGGGDATVNPDSGGREIGTGGDWQSRIASFDPTWGQMAGRQGAYDNKFWDQVVSPRAEADGKRNMSKMAALAMLGMAGGAALGPLGFGGAAGGEAGSTIGSTLADFAPNLGGQGLQALGGGAANFGLTPALAQAAGVPLAAETGGLGFSLGGGAAGGFGGTFGASLAPDFALPSAGTGGQGFNPATAGEGLHAGTTPNLPSMGGGQGFTAPAAGGGTAAQGGVFAPGQASMEAFTPKGTPGTDWTDRLKKKALEKALDEAFQYRGGAARISNDNNNPFRPQGINPFSRGNLSDMFAGDPDAAAAEAMRQLGFSSGRQGIQQGSAEGEQIAGVQSATEAYRKALADANARAESSFGAQQDQTKAYGDTLAGAGYDTPTIQSALDSIQAPTSAADLTVAPTGPDYTSLALVARGGTPLPEFNTTLKKRGMTPGLATPGSDGGGYGGIISGG